ncbi:glucosamine-6-phosphate deaminase [Mariniradius sediminis]|uniref:Glucosamine-6-phosphate deaminase n=1 Tax=Mariniradius sediminis TaxID=2909237 RepID=A0ABS9BS59_9BACT|nr:glucosamine-6-phosphate deaminase [Mariniradius sediminis]MCF1750911.1 glucosamine-6-phosphate deaminase [Mariniradius sediminis]
MEISVFSDPIALGHQAGKIGAQLIRSAIQSQGFANIILATGTSQFETLKQLLQEKQVDWSRVTVFHLDEYIGIPITHRASFRKYLNERFFDQVNLKAYHLIDGEHNPEKECKRLSGIIEKHPIDVAFVGIGENGHLAFNDPPADFHTKEPYIIVELDEACRMQQLGEGWFPDLASVPKRAISMSIQQIMGSKNIICSVPDLRKAQAVKACLEGEISPMHPASILQNHRDCRIFLDSSSSSLLSGR